MRRKSDESLWIQRHDLIEIVIASVLLSLLAAMSLTAVQAAGTQAHFSSNRSDLSRRVNSITTTLERELEGASYQDKDNAVGNFIPATRGMTFVVPASTVTNTDAIQFRRVTGFDPTSTVANPKGVITTGNAVIYAFERLEAAGTDPNNNGIVGEYQLVRIDTVTGRESIVQANILSAGQPGLDSGTAIADPSFVLDDVNPADLTISYSLGAVIAFSGGTRQLVTISVTRNINLRNLNQ